MSDEPQEENDPRLLLSLAANELRSGNAEVALARVRELLPNLQDNPDLLAPGRAVEAQALAALGHGDEALAVLERAIEDAEAADLREHVNGLQGVEEKLRPQIEMARLASISVEDIERTAPHQAARAVLFANKAIAHLAAGDLETAKVLIPLARGAAESSEEPGALVPVSLAAAQVFAAGNDYEAALRALADARVIAEEHLPDALPLIEEMREVLEGGDEGEEG
jgi:tetratricopeptide (TPR) repeat protein